MADTTVAPNSSQSAWRTAAWSMVAAFGAYFCVYVYRKSFTAAGFEDASLWSIGYKTVLITAQVLGYSVSKFIGIKVVAEMPPSRRAAAILVLTGIAEAALLGFGLCPPPYNFVFLFINGLPLGMVFGLVIGFLEGRRMTEATAAGLCVSFILADGVTKTVGAWLLDAGVSQYWMPFVAGLLFAPFLLFFVWMLTRIPPPSVEDVELRSERVPMSRSQRWQFFARFAWGLSLLIFAYLLITVLRSMRADYAREIWIGLGVPAAPLIFTRSEVFVGLGVLVLNGLSVLIRDNRVAFGASMALSIGGFGLLVVALVLLAAEQISGLTFMVLIGLGLYLPYVAVHTTIFERLIAMTRDRANLGYLMYLADAIGYFGYVVVILLLNIFSRSHFLVLFADMCWVTAIAGIVCFALSWLSFTKRKTAVSRHVPVIACAPATSA